MSDQVLHRSVFSEIFDNISAHGFDKKLQKWSLARNQNVSYLYKLWEEKPDRIEVLADKDSEDEQLIIMNRKKFEELLEAHRELVMKTNEDEKHYRLLLHTVKHVTSLSANNKTSSDPTMSSAVELLKMVSSPFLSN